MPWKRNIYRTRKRLKGRKNWSQETENPGECLEFKVEIGSVRVYAKEMKNSKEKIRNLLENA